MARWYQQGLIDRDVLSINSSQLNQKMTTGAAGVGVASVGSGMGVWTDAARRENPRYEIAAVQYPVLNRGDRLIYTIPNQIYSGQDSAAIYAGSRNIELAARFLDYGYSAQGHDLFNFGIEGESFTRVGGQQIFTQEVMTGGANRLPLAQSMARFMRATGAGPFVQNEGYIEQFYALPEQSQALENYVLPGAVATLLPAVTPTQEESRELATIMQEINTYIDERTAAWLLGNIPVNDTTWNEFISTLNRMGIQRAIAIQQGALDRFNRR